MADVIPEVQAITDRITERSKPTREVYLDRISRMISTTPRRMALPDPCFAHAAAACTYKDRLTQPLPQLGIITAYNDMLSAHAPYETYPQILRDALAPLGIVAQVIGATPAMCDGVTQGENGPGNDGLPSRDDITAAVIVALAHNVADAVAYLGVCDKIVPGLLTGALLHGHLPSIFIPAGPMPSGISNDAKNNARQLFKMGKIDKLELRASEMQAYHTQGTCTFYGTANTNQMLMEIMGLHLPGATFFNPQDLIREYLTREAARRVVSQWAGGNNFTPIGHVIDERAVVNGLVGWAATGGSTNHELHIPSFARAGGIWVTRQDLDDINRLVPLIASIYPNGKADVNDFQRVGGMAFLINELLNAGLLHEDVKTVNGTGLSAYTHPVELEKTEEKTLVYLPTPKKSGDENILRPVSNPFRPEGGMRHLTGNLGSAIVKVSAIKPEHQIIEAPVRVFHTQEEFKLFTKNFEETVKTVNDMGGMIAVLRFNGPAANGMPELHKLMEILGTLQDHGKCKVGLLTDGRLSGASGKVMNAIHLVPEAMDGGPIAKLQDGDMVRIDGVNRAVDYIGDIDAFMARPNATEDFAYLRETPEWPLIDAYRDRALPADQGASRIRYDYTPARKKAAATLENA